MRDGRSHDPRTNINDATYDELRKTRQIGEVLARRIIEARHQRQFCTWEDVQHIKGIGRLRVRYLQEKFSLVAIQRERAILVHCNQTFHRAPMLAAMMLQSEMIFGE